MSVKTLPALATNAFGAGKCLSVNDKQISAKADCRNVLSNAEVLVR